ncbi:4736_t:CDS:10, partial [Acaulospora morrowiae]
CETRKCTTNAATYVPDLPNVVGEMGRKDFIQDVKTLREHFRGLNSKASALVKDFDFQDPELSFRFAYKTGKSFTVQIFVNDTSIQSYPENFSALICIDNATDDDANTAAKCLSDVSVDNKSVSEIVATIVPKLCDHFKIALPKELSMNSLSKFSRALGNSSTPASIKKNPVVTNVLTPIVMLKRDLEEVKHFQYNAELLCADEIGFKVVVSIPVRRLGLSLEACEAWNLDPNRYLVCIMQFPPQYIDLQGVVANACQTKAYIAKEGGFKAVKDELKRLYNIQFTVLTSSQPKGVPSRSQHKDDTTESDHFVLSWTLNELLREKFFHMLCDRLWFGIGWAGAEYADYKRNRELDVDFLNDVGLQTNDQIYECLTRDKEPHWVLHYFDSEEMEKATASKNQNFLLLVLRFLRRRILLSTKYCLTCHFLHNESVSSIRPFVCGIALCQHQALVGLGNLFEAVLVNSPVVVDLLISLCYVAISARNLNPHPSKAIGITTTKQLEIANSLIVDWGTNSGTVGQRTEKGYVVYGWKNFDGQVLIDDMLEVFNPETGQSFTVNRCSSTSTVRVLEVNSEYLITDFQITVSASAVNNKSVYLPFRVHRRHERNFLDSSEAPNYQLLHKIIDKLPSVNTMVQYCKKKILKQELDKLDVLCFPLLSWIISSSRTHLRLLESEDEKVQFNDNNGNSGNWKQFIMIMSSPEKEEIFQQEKEKLRKEKDQRVGELFAFHGSPLHNWHSIVRTSLNWNKIVHGRVYGDGVYHSLQAATSSSYAAAGYHRYESGTWKNSTLIVQKCMALCEIINRPSKFTSTNPHLVVKDENWITTRYLFVECSREQLDSDENRDDDMTAMLPVLNPPYINTPAYNIGVYNPYTINMPHPVTSLTNTISNALHRRKENTSFITLDSQYFPVWFNNQPLQIPMRDFSIINNEIPTGSSVGIGRFVCDSSEMQEIINSSDNPTDYNINESILYDTNDDTLDEEEDDEFDPSLLPLPAESSKAATQRICRELKLIYDKQQSGANNDLGFYLDTEKMASVYQWVVQLKDFDQTLPLAQDMARYKVKSIDLEVRFAPDYPFVPPYIRVIRPRLLRFMDGGGGHVTAGGSICMDLLTLGNAVERGWSSVYTIEAVLLQVRMALSSLDPKPARLDRNWNCEYSASEAIDSYIRVANQHGWGVPSQWTKLFGR